MKTGIVILNYNDYETTKKMINSIKKFKILDYILIVDNNSSDDSYENLKKFEDKKVEIIKTDKNNGYASGNNFGIKHLIKEYKVDNIIISNPDIIVSEKTIEVLLNDLKENDISIVAPLIKQGDEILRGWKLPTFIDDLLSNINYVQRFTKKRMLYNDEHYKDDLSLVEVVSGCFFIVKASSIKKVDYYDENTFLYYEENILGKKLKNNNMKSCIDNRVSVIHDHSVSVDKSINSLKKYKILKKSQRYYEKKYNNLNIFGMLLLRLTYVLSYVVARIIYIFRR